VSCSWGAANAYFPLSTLKSRAITRCATEGRGGRGCVVVFAAGNENSDVNAPAQGTVSGFAAHPEVLAVAASNSRDERSTYSNFGREISVCAPSNGAGGWGVLTADVSGMGPMGPLGYAAGDYTYDFGGTSSACPLVAGVAALLLSVQPNLTAREVKQVLQATARKIGPADSYAEGHSPLFGYGCVNAAEAIQMVMPHSLPVMALGDLPAEGAQAEHRATAS
jgi:subtilisin family serine protease